MVAMTLPTFLPKKLRARLSNKPLAIANLNTARGRRLRDIALLLHADIGNAPGALGDCVAIAELQVAAEEARRAPSPDLNAVVRIEGLVDRRRRQLLAEHRAKREPPKPDLDAYVAKLHAEGVTP